MRNRAAIVVLIAVAWPLMATGPVRAVSVPNPPKPQQLTVSGSVHGRLAKGNKVRFKIVASDPLSWSDLDSVSVVLLLHGQVLQDMAFLVKKGALRVGDRPEVPVTEQAFVNGGFFRVNPHTLRMIRHTFSIDVTFWTRVREGIPNGTTVRVVARSQDGVVAYSREDVTVAGGFLTWGTFAIGVLTALFLGAFLTNLRWSRRRREPRPSIWDVLEHRVREERARPPVLVTAAGGGSS